MNKLLIRLCLWVLKLVNYKPEVLDEVKVINTTSNLESRIRRLFIEHSYILDPQDRLLIVDNIIRKEFTVNTSNLIDIYNKIVEEDNTHARATFRTN